MDRKTVYILADSLGIDEKKILEEAFGKEEAERLMEEKSLSRKQRRKKKRAEKKTE